MRYLAPVQVPFRLVDVFAEGPLAGNQLCVVPDPVALDDETMLALAREIGFSETTFVEETGGDRYRMRIFTPGGELPFAGHPTLGTAFVLVAEGRIASPATQVVTAGEFRVVVDLERGFARMRQHAPEFGPDVSDRGRVAASAGLAPAELHPDLPPQVVSTGLPHLIVPAASPEDVGLPRPDVGSLGPLLQEVGADGFYLFATTDEGAKAGMFDATLEIGEDPATGSAAGPRGAYMAARGVGGMPRAVRVRQGEEVGRPSVLHVEVEPEGDSWVTVGGGVFVVGEGSFNVGR